MVHVGVHRSGGGGPLVDLIQKGNHRLLMGDRDIYPQFLGLSQSLEEFAHPIRSYFPSLVIGVYPQVVQGRLLKDGRDGVADGVADYA